MSSLIAKNLQVGSDPSATNNFTIFQPATPDGTLRIGNGNTGITSSLVTLTSGGNLGVGRTSPGERLSVQNTSMTSTTVGANIVAGFRSNALNADTCIALTDGVSASAKYGQIAGSLYWMTADTERMRLDVSGNLGLGVTPSAWAAGFKALQISANTALWSGTGTTGPTYLSNNVIFDGARKYINTSAATEYQQAAGVHYWLTAPSGTAGNAISFTQAMTLDASGNLLVGATTAGAGNSRVYINGNGTNPAFKALANTSTTSVYAGIFRHESTTDGAYIQFVTDGNVETGRIFDSGGTMQYASSSDARLKKNVQPLHNGLSSVLAMKPCTYDIRRGETVTISSAGLIAQEVFEVYPYAVGVGGDNENTNPWSVDYGKLTPLLIKAIQELKAEFDAYKATHP